MLAEFNRLSSCLILTHVAIKGMTYNLEEFRIKSILRYNQGTCKLYSFDDMFYDFSIVVNVQKKD